MNIYIVVNDIYHNDSINEQIFTDVKEAEKYINNKGYFLDGKEFIKKGNESDCYIIEIWEIPIN